jgi:hypothetical protein
MMAVTGPVCGVERGARRQGRQKALWYHPPSRSALAPRRPSIRHEQ